MALGVATAAADDAAYGAWGWVRAVPLAVARLRAFPVVGHWAVAGEAV